MTEPKKTVLAFGEVLWDILPTETVLGGAPFNFAYRVNSLGDRGIMISRLGRDELGQKAFRQITQLGLDTTFIQWDDEHPTGTVPVTFDAGMNPDFVITPNVAYDYIELTDQLVAAASRADSLCFGTLAQRNEKSRQTIAKIIEHSPDSLKIVDINLRKNCYCRDTIISSLESADVLKLNEDEILEIAGLLNLAGKNIPDYCVDILGRWSLRYCLVTLGADGGFACSDDGQKVYVPGYKVSLADSLGSGDAFSAGFVHKILRRKSIRQACEYGNALGALVATQKGATRPVTLEQIDQFLSQGHEGPRLTGTARNIRADLRQFIEQ